MSEADKNIGSFSWISWTKCWNLCWTVRALLYHLMVDLRLGWLTVLSSRKIVEQELNFLVNVPWKKIVTQLLLLTGAIYSICSHLANRAFIKLSVPQCHFSFHFQWTLSVFLERFHCYLKDTNSSLKPVQHQLWISCF